MNRDRIHFLFLNVAHFLDHMFMLIFATVAALAMSREWGFSYGQLVKIATPGFFAFGLFSLPAGWLADKWSREGMVAVFFVGIGLASIATGMAQTPLQVGAGLFFVGVFAAIYHPVGLAIVTQRWKNTGMRLAVNGVWGNLGVACAALITGYLIDHGGWRVAFIMPGVLSAAIGVLYATHQWTPILQGNSEASTKAVAGGSLAPAYKALLIRVSVVVFITAAVSSLIFQSTTFALPKVFDERLQGIAQAVTQWLSATGLSRQGGTSTALGAFTFVVFAVSSLAQLVVGGMLDRYGPRVVFLVVAMIQIVCFALMPGLVDGWALAIAFGFMIGAFGQIPITDYMIGKLSSGPARARIYGARYVVSFTVLAASLPLIAFVHETFGFDMLFRMLAVAASVIFAATACLPTRLPAPAIA